MSVNSGRWVGRANAYTTVVLKSTMKENTALKLT